MFQCVLLCVDVSSISVLSVVSTVDVVTCCRTTGVYTVFFRGGEACLKGGTKQMAYLRKGYRLPLKESFLCMYEIV